MEDKVLISGFGGQGVMLIGQLLGYTAKDIGLNATYYPAYGPEQRGGTANCTVIISEKQIGSPIPSQIDVLIAMNEPSLEKFLPKVRAGGHVLVNSSHIKIKVDRKDVNAHYLAADDMAFDLGFTKAANMIMMGAYLKLSSNLSTEEVLDTLKVQMARKADYFKINEAAINKGFNSVNQ